MSLLFNMLSRLVITFLPRSKHLLISWLQSLTICCDLEPPKIKSDTVFPLFPHLFPRKWWDQMPWCSFIFILINFLIGGQLLYNIVLVSAIHLLESAIGICMYPPSWNSFSPPIPFHHCSSNTLSVTAMRGRPWDWVWIRARGGLTPSDPERSLFNFLTQKIALKVSL